MYGLTELKIEGTVASPPEVVRDAASGDPLVRCRISVDVPRGGNPDDKEACKRPLSALSLTVVATHWQPAHALSMCSLGNEVGVIGELRRNPRDGRLELYADWLLRMCTPAEVEAANG